MEESLSILIVDDDVVARKTAVRAMEIISGQIEEAETGDDGLRKAIASSPDVILLDVEMPAMDGFQVCHQLRDHEKTRDSLIVFISSHGDLRSRMQGYEAGGDDYLVKPFDAEELAAHLRKLIAYRAEKNRLSSGLAEAQKAAIVAMTSSSELGMAMQFIEKTYTCHTYQALGDALLSFCGQFQLRCVIMMHIGTETLWYHNEEAISPLEHDMMSMLDRNKRFIDFGGRTIINYDNLSLLVRNMPLDDMDRYGRLKDFLPMLLAAVDAKVLAIGADLELQAQSEALGESFTQIRSQLYYLAKSLIEKSEAGEQMLNVMVTNLNNDLLTMGLDDDQEAQLLSILDRSISEVVAKTDSRLLIHQSFSRVLANLKAVNEQQLKLNDAFHRMSELPSETEQPEEDDGIEFF